MAACQANIKDYYSLHTFLQQSLCNFGMQSKRLYISFAHQKYQINRSIIMSYVDVTSVPDIICL